MGLEYILNKQGKEAASPLRATEKQRKPLNIKTIQGFFYSFASMMSRF